MTAGTLSFEDLISLTGGRAEIVDIACPLCGPERHAARNRVRRVLRIWATDPNWASYSCIRCGVEGWAAERHKHGGKPINREALARAQAEAEARSAKTREERRTLARWLWRRAASLSGTIGERYIREARGISCPLPPTLRFLQGRREHPPALVAAFARAEESEPGVLSAPEREVEAVQLIKLKPDGSGKADADPPKITIGAAKGTPIVLAPPNDLLGLAIVEGPEDGLSIFEATGLGVWAAGGAKFLPALADAVPDWIDFVNVCPDADKDGQKGAAELTALLRSRGLCCEEVSIAS